MISGKNIAEIDLRQFFENVGTLLSQKKPNRQELEQFFSETRHLVKETNERQRKIDKIEATAFNVFSLIEPDENKLSDIIADLLDPKGSHGQGDIFLRLLFAELGLAEITFLNERV